MSDDFQMFKNSTPIANPQKHWNDKVQTLVGKTVKSVRYLSHAEWSSEFDDWYSVPVVIEFTDGTYIIPMSDDEGNNGGSLMTNLDDLETVPVLSPRQLKKAVRA
jgi:hypothetical protein